MATDTNLNQLVINKLTKAQYQEAKEAGSIVETEIYMIIDDGASGDGSISNIDDVVLITVDDNDTICGTSIEVVDLSGVVF